MSIESEFGNAAIHYRQKETRLGLKGSNCNECGIKHIPYRPICPDCGTAKNQEAPNTEVEIDSVSGEIESQSSNPSI